MDRMPDVTVVHNPAQSRYEVRVDGELAGYTRYRPAPGVARIDFTHTEIDPRFEGRGLGGRLAAGALDDVRASGGHAVVTCPFMAAYVKQHPGYADVVVGP
jgi:uncharacterized protein